MAGSDQSSMLSNPPEMCKASCRSVRCLPVSGPGGVLAGSKKDLVQGAAEARPLTGSVLDLVQRPEGDRWVLSAGFNWLVGVPEGVRSVAEDP